MMIGKLILNVGDVFDMDFSIVSVKLIETH